MKRIHAGWLIGAINSVSFAEGVFAAGGTLSQKSSDNAGTYLRNIADELNGAQVPATVASCKTAERVWSKGPVPTQRIYGLLEAVSANLTAELTNRTMFIVAAGREELLKSRQRPFGDEVYLAFPAMRDDLAEAAMCLVMERHSATVFHLMRAMERAVGLIAQHLSGVQTHKVWGFLLSDMKGAIDKMPKGFEKVKWLHVHALLYSVKEAWRNDIMHPKQSYTDGQASDLLNACRAFFVSLALALKDEKPLEEAVSGD